MNYVAFLRGINVGGHKKIRMVDLKAMFEMMKFSNVRTYINSGNVLFETSDIDSEKLTKNIEEAITKTFGFEVKVMIRTIDELQDILDHNPYPNPADDEKMYISFL